MRTSDRAVVRWGTWVLVVATSTLPSFQVPTAWAFETSVHFNSVSLTLTNDANADGIANPGDTVHADADITNSDDASTDCGGTITTVTADMTAYGGSATEGMACETTDGAGHLTFGLDFPVADAGASGINVGANDPASEVNVTATDADETAPSTTASNPLGDGTVDTAAVNGVNTTSTTTDTGGGTGGGTTADTTAPTITDANVSMDASACTGGVAPCMAGDTITFVWDNSATGDNNTDVATVSGDLSQFGGDTAATLTEDDGTTDCPGGTTGAADAGLFCTSLTLAADATADTTWTVTATDTSGNSASLTDGSGTTTSTGGTGGTGGGTTADTTAPTITDANVSMDASACTGTSGACLSGDTVTFVWDNSATGDNNTDVASVTGDLSQFGGDAAVALTEDDGTNDCPGGTAGTADAGLFCTTLTLAADATADATWVVTATDTAGNTTTLTDGSGSSTSTISGGGTTGGETSGPTVTPANIHIDISGCHAAACHPGDAVIISWNNSATGDDNASVTDASQVTFDASELGGSSSVQATSVKNGVFQASVLISGDTSDGHAHVSAKVTDDGGMTGPVQATQTVHLFNPGSGGGGGGTPFVYSSILLTVPDSVSPGDTLDLSWTAIGSDVGAVELSYWSADQTRYVDLAKGLPATGTFSWQLPDTLSGNLLIRARVRANDGMFTAVDSRMVSLTGSVTQPTQAPTSFATSFATAADDAANGIHRDVEGRRTAPMTSVTAPSPISGFPEAVSAVVPGEFIRDYDDNAVYFVTDDQHARPFMDATTFFTYGASFDDVVWVTDSTLGTLPTDAPMPAMASDAAGD
jgi:hypothetical protein